MSISEEEWNALPEEEKTKRINDFKIEIKRVLREYDKETIVAAFIAVLDELKKKEIKK